jgi:predicted CXXCH cytochrome family protein
VRRGAGLGLVATLVVATSCSGPTRDRVVRFLFDDPPGDEPADVAAPAGTGTEEAPAEAGGPGADAPIELVIHSPYEDRDCEACHESSGSISFARGGEAEIDPDAYRDRSGARLAFPRDEICFECHDDMTAESLAEEGEYIHPPAEEGECLECHDPHQSRFVALLRGRESAHDVCFECHDEDDWAESEPHEDLGEDERTCWDCHEAHVSDEEALL